MRWIWPINWYWRIRQLEAENALLRAQVVKLDSYLRAAAVREASMAAVYNGAVASLTAMAVSSIGGHDGSQS